MKNQALFSAKDKSKKLKCRLLQFCFPTSGLTMLHNHGQDHGATRGRQPCWDYSIIFQSG